LPANRGGGRWPRHMWKCHHTPLCAEVNNIKTRIKQELQIKQMKCMHAQKNNNNNKAKLRQRKKIKSNNNGNKFKTKQYVGTYCSQKQLSSIYNKKNDTSA
jgi:hypothetical protein